MASFRFSLDSRYFVVTSPSSLAVHDVKTTRKIWAVEAGTRVIDGADFLHGKLAFVYRDAKYGLGHALPYSSIEFRRITDGHILHTVPLKKDIFSDLRFIRDDEVAAMGSTILVCRSTSVGPERDIGACLVTDFTVDGSVVACGFKTGSIVIRDVQSGRTLRSIKVPNNVLPEGVINPYAQAAVIYQLQFFPDNCRLMVTAQSQKAGFAIWDSVTGQMLKTFDVGDATLRFAISPDGQTLACAGWKRSVSLWDVRTKTLLWSQGTRSFDNPYCGLAFSLDGRLLARQVDKHTIQIWKLK